MSESPSVVWKGVRVLLFGGLGFAIACAWHVGASGKWLSIPAWTELASSTVPSAEVDSFNDDVLANSVVEPIREVSAKTAPDLPKAEAAPTTPSSLEERAIHLLQTKCGDCHSGDEREATGQGFDVLDVTSFGDIVRPGHPEDSSLVRVIRDGSMPEEGSGIEPLSETEMALLESWITSQRSDRETLTLGEELTRVVHDRESIGDQASGSIYISLRNLHNRHDVTDAQLELARYALSKCINSLHWLPRLIHPIAVDDNQTLYRVSVTELGWSEKSVQSLMDRYPYRAIPSDQTDTETRRAARVLLRLDWLVNQLSQPEVYHQFLMDTADVRNVDAAENPFETLQGLLEFLHVDYEQRFAAAKIDRVYINKGDGTRGSEVSDNYRVLDRLEAITGVVWISHDFQFNEGVHDIKRRPWGPPSKNRDDAISFHQNGGEVIFELPNGLHGYYIADAEGARLETAPVEIVREPILQQSPTRKSEISTGVACFRCHAGGFRNRETILPELADSGLSVRERPRVLNDSQFSKLVQLDNAGYLNTLDRIAEAMDLSFAEDERREPISEVVRLYRQPLETSTVAVELEQAFGNTNELEAEDRERASEELLVTIASVLRGELQYLVELGEQTEEGARGVSERIDDVIQDASVSKEVQREDFESVFSHILFQFQLMEPS